jgi:hypothetical protein
MRASANSTPTFRGAAYVPRLDRARLSVQIERIRSYMLGVEWRTLREIKAALEVLYATTVFPESSISAQLRNLRKPGFSYRLLRRRAGVRGLGAGIWGYLLLPPARKKVRLKKWHSQWHSFVTGFSRVHSALTLSGLAGGENALLFSVSCKKGGFVNDETTPEVGPRRTKQEASAAPERSAAAPRTGAPSERNLAPERTWRWARCEHQHLGTRPIRLSEHFLVANLQAGLDPLVGGKNGTCPIRAVVSMGQRNTRLEPAWH